MAVPTLVMVEGFEWGLNPLIAGITNGGGLATTVTNAGVMMCDTSVKRSGAYSLKIAEDGVTAARVAKTFTSSPGTMLVGSFYFYSAGTFTGTPAASLIWTGTTAIPQLRINTDGTLSALFSGGTAQTKAGSICDSTWHLIDFKVDVSANPQLMDWQVDGAAQTQAVRNVAASTISVSSVGTNANANNLTFWVDDLVLSVTSGDYPIGAHSVFAVKPTGDGTHNAGTNTIEDNAGTDIASPNAFPILDNWPPDVAAYIRQVTIDTGAYAEVTFANHDATMDVIWDAAPLVAYSSSTSAVNEGGTIISIDNFTTPLEVYGTPSARTNYNSASNGTAIFYKTKNTSTAEGIITRPGATWDTTSFDNLKARVGYSGDVTGNPRWLALMIQYAGTLGAGGGGSTTESVGFIPI